MNEKLNEQLLVVSGIVIAALVISNRVKARRIKKLYKIAINQDSAIKIIQRVIPPLMEQMPDDITIPETVYNDMLAYTIMIENGM